MAVNAVFVADFSKFDTAVKDATVKLKGIEEGASGAEQSLNRMANQFTGVKMIQNATLMAEAIQRVGGVSTLTAAELTRVGRQADEAAAKLVALGEKVPPEIKKVSDAFHTLQDEQAKARQQQEGGGFLGDFGNQVAATAAGMFSAQAAMQALGTAWRSTTAFVKESITAYAEAEAADTRMVQAMRQQGMAAPELVDKYRALASTFQQTTVYSDDLTQEMIALLVQVGDIGPSKMQAALAASTDLSAGLGVDLRTATELVAKAAAGHTETLGRYGIVIDEATLKTQGFDAVLGKINGQFGGQAAAQAETYAGKVAQISNSYNNVQEAVGKFIVQSPIAERVLTRTTEATKALDDATSNATLTWGDFAVAFGGQNLGFLVGATEQATKLGNAIENINRQVERRAPKLPQAEQAPAAAGGASAMGLQAAQERYAAALKEVNDKTYISAQTTEALQKTIDDLDGSVVTAIEDYHALGVSVDSLANFYGVTVTQVEAVIAVNDRWKKSMEDNKRGMEEFMKTEWEAYELGQKILEDGIKKNDELNNKMKARLDLLIQMQTATTKAEDAAKKVNIERNLGPGIEDRGAQAAAIRDKALADIEQQRSQAAALGGNIDITRFEQQIQKIWQDFDEFLFGALQRTKQLPPGGGGTTTNNVSVNVSGVWDPASVGKIVDVIGPELMRRTGRQTPAA